MALPSYHHTSYPSAWLAGAAGFLYSVSFVLIAKASPGLGNGLSGFFLLIGGIFGASALLGLYMKLEPAAGGYALWAVIFGVAGAIVAALHGGYDLANAIHPPGQNNPFPSAIDPRGLGTFGFAGISLLAFAYVMGRDVSFPVRLSYLGYVSGALLVLIYMARLVILNASSPLVLIPAGLEGFIVNPAWYIWLGFALRREVAR
ncbi:MAG TPA: hypothetical protein VNA65_06975 [Candidatus Dormibacteraeota bacterium]|nr:hypothetical protein [Candidatus Dormibacteraeota bacterium]